MHTHTHTNTYTHESYQIVLSLIQILELLHIFHLCRSLTGIEIKTSLLDFSIFIRSGYVLLQQKIFSYGSIFFVGIRTF